MLREFGELIDRIAAERSVLLVLEDLHWSDHATVQLLGYLARRRGPAALMVLGTFRPTELILQDHPAGRPAPGAAAAPPVHRGRPGVAVRGGAGRLPAGALRRARSRGLRADPARAHLGPSAVRRQRGGRAGRTGRLRRGEAGWAFPDAGGLAVPRSIVGRHRAADRPPDARAAARAGRGERRRRRVPAPAAGRGAADAGRRGAGAAGRSDSASCRGCAASARSRWRTARSPHATRSTTRSTATCSMSAWPRRSACSGTAHGPPRSRRCTAAPSATLPPSWRFTSSAATRRPTRPRRCGHRRSARAGARRRAAKRCRSRATPCVSRSTRSTPRSNWSCACWKPSR